MKRYKKLYMVILILIAVVSTSVCFSYAFFANKNEQHGKLNVVVGDLKYEFESSDLVDNSILIAPGETKEITLTLTSLNSIASKYEIYYNLSNNSNVEVGYTNNPSSGIIGANEVVEINVVIKNKESREVTVTFGLETGLKNNELVINGNSLSEINLCDYEIGHTWNFDYTGGEQEFVVPCDGTYKLETWGAQGGNYTDGTGSQGGKGGYSTGNYTSDGNDKFYVVVGGQGDSPILDSTTPAAGGYNGGGTGANILNYSSYNWRIGGAGGGGATHISKSNTLLKDTETSNLIIVAGAGGGAGANSGSSAKQYNNGGAGGGSTGTNGSGSMLANYSSIHPGLGGSQTGAGCPQSLNTKCGGKGYGGSNGAIGSAFQAGGGGAGYYGGGSGENYGASGGGGSGYIGNTLLTNKAMYCYNCTTSNKESTKTVSTTCHSSTPTENCAKEGNGYARITLVSLN